MATVAGLTAVENKIIRRIGEDRYKMWFRGHTRLQVKEQTLIVGVPNLHFQEWLENKFGEQVAAAAREALGKGIGIKFQIDAELFRAARAEQEQAKKQPAPSSKRGGKAKVKVELPPPPVIRERKKKGKKGAATPSMFPEPSADQRNSARLGGRTSTRRWHNLNSFVVGACNRVAFAAAQSVVEEPGQGANPLTVHGPVGTGKTHLLEGVFAGLKKRDPSLNVRYVTAEEFTNRFVQAMRASKLSSFRRQFRDCDVLLLDNLHFLAKKKATFEEFLHTFDVLASAGKQIVVTMDCHPRLAEDMLPEVVDRLLGGTVWGLQPPDGKTRLDVLQAKSADAGLPIPEEVLADLAQRLRGNVRELEGAIGNLRHYSKVMGKPVDKKLAAEALGDLLRHAVRVVSLEDIDDAICAAMRIKAGTLQTKDRAWSVSHPRMLAVYLARKHTAASYSEIGKHFGGRNHSTAVAAEKKVRQWIDEDATLATGAKPWQVREVIEAVERKLRVA